MDEVPKTLVVLGAGGMANLLYWQVREFAPETRMVFIEDEGDRTLLDLGDKVVPIIKDWDLTAARRASRDLPQDAFQYFTLAVSDPIYKIRFVKKALARGLKPAPTLIYPSNPVHGPRRVGVGGFFSSGTLIQAMSVLGDYVTLAEHSSVAHHCVIGDYATLSTGSLLLGNVTIGEGVWLGGGTAVRDRIKIAPWVQTGVNSAVVKDVLEPGIMLVGVPARKMRDALIPPEARPLSGESESGRPEE